MTPPEDPTRDERDQAAAGRPDPLTTLLDALVFAPVGAFLHGPETVGDLAAKGRQDVANAKVVGRLALDRAVREGRSRMGEVGGRWVEVLAAAARAAGVPLADLDPDDGFADDDDDGPRLRIVGQGHGSGPAGAPSPDDAGTDGPAVESLAIPGYDTLAASQVVPRLDDLSDDELADVQEYERAHRGRMTILSRIAQLRAS